MSERGASERAGGDAGLAALSGPAREVEAYLREFVQGSGLPQNLREAALYALMGPGKRLRPALTWHCCAAMGVEPGRACVAAGAAVELVHCFSLVHDDLPALDNDDLRRGRATLHVHTSEPMAILAGDALLTMAFQLLAREFGAGGGRLIEVLSTATAMMIGGQVLDTLGGMDAAMPAAERLELIHRGKTGALIRAACQMGVLVAFDGPGVQARARVGMDRAMELVTIYADAVGLMFQIVDDLLDVEGAEADVGKRIGKDAAAGKLTYPAAMGVEASRVEVARLLAIANEAAGTLGDDGKVLGELAGYLSSRRR